MRQTRNYYLLRIWLGFAFFAVLLCSAASSLAQKTVEQDAGGGRKLELDYNATGQVTQQRTIGADGKLEERVDYERSPGYFGPDRLSTSYWPDGKVHIITKTTNDANANFTGELVQVFDEAGTQVTGHRVTHNPMTNVYTCADWNTAAQDYKSIKCPSGEESGGESEEVKKFTRDEVMQHLTAARKAGREQTVHSKTLVSSTASKANPEVGLVLPAQVYPGERVSGSVVTNSAEYEGLAGVTVTRVAAPLEPAGEASTLAGWTVEVPGEKPQPADGPVVFTVPRGSSELNVTFRQTGNSAQSVSQSIAFPPGAPKKQKAPGSFEGAALCLKDQLCTVRGPFSGDSSKTFAAFEDRPAIVVAETPDTAYIQVPKLTEPGARPMFLAEGSKVVALPVAVGEFNLKNGDRELEAGQTLMTFPILEGPSDIPDAAWRSGTFPATNLEEARKLIPGFQLPKEDRKAREKGGPQKGASEPKREAEEKKGGAILLVVKNRTPEQVSIRGAKDQMIVFHLNDESFSRGGFKYDLPVDAIKSGHFVVKGYAILLLAPVQGQEFSSTPSSAVK